MTDGFLGFRTYSGEAQSHRHDHHQVVLPHQGRLELEVQGRGEIVASGVGAFIAAGARHTFLSEDDNTFVVPDAPVLTASSQAALPPTGVVFFPVTAAVQGLLDYLTATLARVEPSGSLRVSWSNLLLDSLARSQSAVPTRAQVALSRAMAFMQAHSAEPIRVSDIAAAAGLSTTRLHALFREHLDTSPHAVLARLRVNAAQRLLASTSLSIAEVAVRTGHADQSALTRRLRLARGVTPAAFRRAIRTGRAPGGA